MLLAAVVAATALALASGVSAAPWMASSFELLSNRTLRQITLPGTHDSGAYSLTTDLQPGDSAGPVCCASTGRRPPCRLFASKKK